jgi:hypothetical protein
MSGIQLDRPAGQHGFLRAVVMLLLLLGAGALVASQVIPKPQQKQIEADARGLLRRGAEQVSAAIETWKARRNESLADEPAASTGVGVERAPAGAAAGAQTAGGVAGRPTELAPHKAKVRDVAAK